MREKKIERNIYSEEYFTVDSQFKKGFCSNLTLVLGRKLNKRVQNKYFLLTCLYSLHI